MYNCLLSSDIWKNHDLRVWSGGIYPNSISAFLTTAVSLPSYRVLKDSMLNECEALFPSIFALRLLGRSARLWKCIGSSNAARRVATAAFSQPVHLYLRFYHGSTAEEFRPLLYLRASTSAVETHI